MKVFFAMALLLGACCIGAEANAATANSCKVCSDQQKACTKNYAGPTCKTEYQMCMKSCGAKKGT